MALPEVLGGSQLILNKNLAHAVLFLCVGDVYVLYNDCVCNLSF